LNFFFFSHNNEVTELKKKVSTLVNSPVDEIILIYNGNPIQDESKTLKELSISDDDIVQLIRRYTFKNN